MSIIEDWDFQVVRVDDVGVRVPRRNEVEEPARVDAPQLPQLAPRLPVQVPPPQEVCGAHGSMLHSWIPGTPASRDIVDIVDAAAFASQLAAFVSALHRYPAGGADDLDVPRVSILDQVDRLEARGLPVLADQRAPKRLLAQAREHLGTYEPAWCAATLALPTCCAPASARARGAAQAKVLHDGSVARR